MKNISNIIVYAFLSTLGVTALFSCSKESTNPEVVEAIVGSDEVASNMGELQKRPTWAILGVSVKFGWPEINPHYDPEVPPNSDSNPLTVCLSWGLCEIRIGSAVDGGDINAYPQRTANGELQLYFDKAVLERSEIDEFNSGYFVISKSVDIHGEWLRELGFESSEYHVQKSDYPVTDDGRYFIVTL